MIGTGALIAGGIGLSALNTGMNWLMQKDQQKFNAEQAQKTREFEDYMYSNAMTKRRADLERAGLNPAGTLTGTSAVPNTASATSGIAGHQESSLLSSAISSATKATILENKGDFKKHLNISIDNSAMMAKARAYNLI